MDQHFEIQTTIEIQPIRLTQSPAQVETMPAIRISQSKVILMQNAAKMPIMFTNKGTFSSPLWELNEVLAPIFISNTFTNFPNSTLRTDFHRYFSLENFDHYGASLVPFKFFVMIMYQDA